MAEKTQIARDIKSAVGNINAQSIQAINAQPTRPIPTAPAMAPVAATPPIGKTGQAGQNSAPTNRQQIPLGTPTSAAAQSQPPAGISVTINNSPTAKTPGTTPSSPAPAAANAPAPPAGGGGGALSDDSEAKIAQVKKDIEKLNTLLTTLKNNVDKVNEKMEVLDETIANLASVYEVVTNQINPFIDHNESQAMGSHPAPATPPAPMPAPAPIAAPTPLPSPSHAAPLPPPEMHPAAKTSPAQKPEPAKPSARPVHAETNEDEPVRVNLRDRGKEFLLSEIDQSDIHQVQNVLEWLAFLLLKVGHAGLPRILEYYRNVGWISNAVKDQLEEYAKGLEVEDEPKNAKIEGLPLSDQKHSLELFYKIVEHQER